MCLWFFKMLSDFFSFVFRYSYLSLICDATMYMYTNTCVLSDLKKRNILTKASYVSRCDKRFKKRKGNLQILWCFSVDLRIMKQSAAKCQDNQLKHPKLVETSFFQREILKRTHQENANNMTLHCVGKC